MINFTNTYKLLGIDVGRVQPKNKGVSIDDNSDGDDSQYEDLDVP